jgi:hypothetical protein
MLGLFKPKTLSIANLTSTGIDYLRLGQLKGAFKLTGRQPSAALGLVGALAAAIRKRKA